MRQLGQGKTPKFEREKTPLFAADENRTIFTYRVGPVIVEDAFSGNRLDDIGVVTDRLIFCFDDPHQLAACDRPDTRKNAAPTMFGTSTARDSTDPAKLNPAIVSHDKCGSCHGYSVIRKETKIVCGDCHSRTTERNRHFADTTCWSGHDTIDGEDVPAYRMKTYAKRADPAFGWFHK